MAGSIPGLYPPVAPPPPSRNNQKMSADNVRGSWEVEETKSPQSRTTTPDCNDDGEIDHISEIPDDSILDEFFLNSRNDL